MLSSVDSCSVSGKSFNCFVLFFFPISKRKLGTIYWDNISDAILIYSVCIQRCGYYFQQTHSFWLPTLLDVGLLFVPIHTFRYAVSRSIFVVKGVTAELKGHFRRRYACSKPVKFRFLRPFPYELRTICHGTPCRRTVAAPAASYHLECCWSDSTWLGLVANETLPNLMLYCS